MPARLINRRFKANDSERILRAHIHNHLLRADGIRTYKHTLDKVMRITFDNRAVHKRAGIALVSVADEIFRRTFRCTRRVPLKPSRKSGAAAPCKPGRFYFLNDSLGSHTECAFYRLIAVPLYVVVYVRRVNNAAIPKCNTRLLIKKAFVLSCYFKAVKRRKITAFNSISNYLRVALLNSDKPLFECISVVNINYRLQKAHTDTSSNAKVDAIQIFKRFIYLMSAGCDTAAALTDNYSHSFSSFA